MAAVNATSDKVPTVSTTPSSSDVTRRMVCGGLAGMIAKVSTTFRMCDTKN